MNYRLHGSIQRRKLTFKSCHNFYFSMMKIVKWYSKRIHIFFHNILRFHGSLEFFRATIFPGRFFLKASLSSRVYVRLHYRSWKAKFGPVEFSPTNYCWNLYDSKWYNFGSILFFSCQKGKVFILWAQLPLFIWKKRRSVPLQSINGFQIRNVYEILYLSGLG